MRLTHSIKRNVLCLDAGLRFAEHHECWRASDNKQCKACDETPATAPATSRPSVSRWHQLYQLEVAIIADLQHRQLSYEPQPINHYIFNQFNGW